MIIKREPAFPKRKQTITKVITFDDGEYVDIGDLDGGRIYYERGFDSEEPSYFSIIREESEEDYKKRYDQWKKDLHVYEKWREANQDDITEELKRRKDKKKTKEQLEDSRIERREREELARLEEKYRNHE